MRDDDKTAFVLLLLTLSFVAGWVGHSIRERKIVMKLADATLPYPVSPSCVPPDEQERAVLSIAASILEIDNLHSYSPLKLGAEKFLAAGMYRRSGNKTISICTPPDIYDRAERAITTHKLFSKGRLVETQLQLASKLAEPSQDIVEAVATVAFDKIPQQSAICGF